MTALLAHVRLRELMRAARLQNASDVHVCAGLRPALRIDGVLELQQMPDTTPEELLAMSSALLDEDAIATLHGLGDVTVTRPDGEGGSVRVHAYREAGGISLAIRLLAAGVPSLESLQMPAIVGSFLERPQGLVIFAGPTGSGKSTALAALVDRINRTQARHVLTIEDPVEYRHRSDRSIITQRELGRDVRTYADALRGALRSDPDVILIGEMRDSLTMHAALTAAETGHLVFTTLHTGDAAQTIDRIVGAFTGPHREQARMQLAQTLVAVVCTRLLPRANARGRRSAVEVLVATDAVRALIRDGKTHQLRNAISTGRSAGMQTLESHLAELVAHREVSPESAKLASGRCGELRFENGLRA